MARTRTTSPLELANHGLAFLLEVAVLVGFALLAALAPDGWPRVVAGVVAVAAVIVLWALYAAPRSPRRLQMPALLIFKLAVFAVAAAGFVVAGEFVWATLFVLLSALNFGGMAWFGRF